MLVPEGKIPFRRGGYRWEDNTKMGLRDIWLQDIDWIQLAQDRVLWPAIVITVVMKILCSINMRSFLLAK
jgi:hypothetical protein